MRELIFVVCLQNIFSDMFRKIIETLRKPSRWVSTAFQNMSRRSAEKVSVKPGIEPGTTRLWESNVFSWRRINPYLALITPVDKVRQTIILKGVWGFNTNPYINSFGLRFVLAYWFPCLPTWGCPLLTGGASYKPLLGVRAPPHHTCVSFWCLLEDAWEEPGSRQTEPRKHSRT